MFKLAFGLLCSFLFACNGMNNDLPQNKAIYAGNPDAPKPKVPSQLDGVYAIENVLPAGYIEETGFDVSYFDSQCTRDSAANAQIKLEGDTLIISHFINFDGYFTDITMPIDAFLANRNKKYIQLNNENYSLECEISFRYFSRRLYVTLGCRDLLEDGQLCSVTASKEMTAEESKLLQNDKTIDLNNREPGVDSSLREDKRAR